MIIFLPSEKIPLGNFDVFLRLTELFDEKIGTFYSFETAIFGGEISTFL